MKLLVCLVALIMVLTPLANAKDLRTARAESVGMSS